MTQEQTTVGGYRLLSRIGEGGMGVVHLAQAPDGRRVALKVLRPHVVGDEEGRQRLAREVSSLQRVRSPHVAEVLDADPWGEAPYVVTRFVPGHSLQETVRADGPLPAGDLAHVGARLLQAVRDVHAAGVLHRDLKPTNVVMEGRSPVLIDFGLARLADDPRLTTTGYLLGTPGYVAPEVLVGDEATAAGDVHGWAATMAYAATGRPPYGGGHTLAILDRTRRGECDLDGVPPALRALLAACLVPEPLDRPTVTETLVELEGLGGAGLGGPPAHSPEQPPEQPADHTVPWQTVPREAPPTQVTPAQVTPAPVDPPTRQYTVVAPRPVQPAPYPGQPSGQPHGHPLAYPPPPLGPRPLSGAARLRRALMLLALLAVVALAFRAAPYLTFGLLALGAVVTRGFSRAQEAARRRRSVRGTRWFDGPMNVLAYPWHTVRGALGALLLLGFAALAAASVVGASVLLLGARGPDALLAGGAVLALAVWWGPASARVRHPVRGLLGLLARPVWPGWLAVAGLALGALGLALAFQGEVGWWPAPGSPWQQLRSTLPEPFVR